MTTEDLKKALSQDTREKVDVNLGQVSLRSTISRGGQYNVVTQETPKENSFTQLSKALNQFPQLAGQFKNIQQQAGIEKVQGMSPIEIKEELKKRAEGGDESAKSFIYDLFQKEAVDEELYRQVLKTEVIPKLQTLEAELSNASPSEMNKILNSEDPIAELEKRYNDVIPGEVDEMVANSSHQKALHNEMLRRIPGLAGKTHATLIEKQHKFTEASAIDNILLPDDSNVFTSDEQPALEVNDDGEIPSLPGDPVPGVDYIKGAGGTLLPSDDPFQVEPKDPIVNEEKPRLPRVPQSGPRIRSAGLETIQKEADSDLSSLEQFMMGDTDYVSVAGNPAQLGKESVLSQVSLVDETGKIFNLENVPIKIEKASSKTTPEGVFKLVSEGRLQPKGDGSYINDGEDGAITKDTKPVKLTPKQETELSVNTITKERTDKAKQLNAIDNAKYTDGLNSIQKGIIKNHTSTTWRKKIEERSLDTLGANIQENLNTIDTFLEQVKEGKLLLNGKRYTNDYISKLQRLIDTEERRREYADDPLGDDIADKHKINIANILVQTEGGEFTTEEADEALSKELVSAYKLYRNSQIGEKERDEIVTEASRVKELISRFDINDDNVDFYALIDNRRPIFEGLGAADLKRQYTDPDAIVAKWEQLGKDVSGLKVTKEDDWGTAAKESWNKILYAAPLEAWQAANARAERDVIKEFVKRGYKKARVFDLMNEQGETVGIKSYYRDLVERYYTEESGKISDDSLADLRRRANEFRSGNNLSDLQRDAGVTILDTPERAAAKVAKALEQQQQDNDLLDEDGNIVPTLPDETTEQALDRFNKTMEDEAAREAMLNSNPDITKRQKLIEQVYRKTLLNEGSYYKRHAINAGHFARKKQFGKEEEIQKQAIARSKNIGLPMEIHRNGAAVKPSKYASYSLDLNPEGVSPDGKNRTPPLYERKETPKTHIYSYYAAREGAYNVFDKLDELFNMYFPGGSEEERNQFRTDQVELARKIGFGLPEKEDNNK